MKNKFGKIIRLMIWQNRFRIYKNYQEKIIFSSIKSSKKFKYINRFLIYRILLKMIKKLFKRL